MPEFIKVAHPDLPGQTVLMVNPRNGWAPVTDEPAAEPPKRATRKKKGDDVASNVSASAELDTPTAGTSDPTEKE